MLIVQTGITGEEFPKYYTADSSIIEEFITAAHHTNAPTWLAKRRDTLVLSSGSLMMALIICSIGVIPVPPAISPTLVA